MRRPEMLTSLLDDFFKLSYGCMIEFLQIFGGKSGLFGSELKEYKHGRFVEMLRKYFNSELTYLCFIEEYTNMVSKWLEIFSCLVHILGSDKYYEILSGKVKLDRVINTSETDTCLLKFWIKNFLNPNLSDLEATCELVLEKSADALEMVSPFKGDSRKSFIGLVEKQVGDWLLLYDEVQNSLRNLTQSEDKNQIVSALTFVAQKFIGFFEKIKQTRKYIKISEEKLCHFVAGGFVDFPIVFKKLRENVAELFDHLMKMYEHVVNCFSNISTALWGEEAAQHKIEGFIKSGIVSGRFVSKKLSVKDLAFGLALARSELGQAQLASQGLYEKRTEISMMENNLPKIEGVQVLLNRVTRLLELRKKYLYKINDIMVDIQKVLQQSAEPEKPIFGV
ncbi:MAG: hypothetical protein QXO71_10355 [Candidatus Jordarchaeaceae archaeon]